MIIGRKWWLQLSHAYERNQRATVHKIFGTNECLAEFLSHVHLVNSHESSTKSGTLSCRNVVEPFRGVTCICMWWELQWKIQS